MQLRTQYSILKCKKFWFSILALLDNKFFTTAETPEILALHYTLDTVLYIFKQQIRNLR